MQIGNGKQSGRVRRFSQIWKGIAFIVIIIAGVYATALIGNIVIQNYRMGKYIDSTENYENIDISMEVKQGEIPLFLQFDKRWGNAVYGEDVMAETGCGPTCLSMVYCGLTGDDKWNPYKLACRAELEGYYIYGSGTAWDMMTELAIDIGLNAYELNCSRESIISELQSGHPIICSMRPGDFTTAGHFIVLSGMNTEGNVIVKDPNSQENSNKTWEIERLMPQIKNLWGYCL